MKARWIGGWLLLLLVFVAPRAVDASDEFQCWIDGNITVPLSTPLKAKLGTESKLNDRGTMVYQDSDVGFVYTGVAPWLDLGFNYKLMFSKVGTNTWQSNTRPSLEGTARFKVFGLAFSDRVRLEYSSGDKIRDFATVRNKISLNPPFYLEPTREGGVGWHYYQLRPFGTYELFYSANGEAITAQRFQIGVSYSFTERAFCDFYYLYQLNSLSDIDFNLNVAGAKLKLLF